MRCVILSDIEEIKIEEIKEEVLKELEKIRKTRKIREFKDAKLRTSIFGLKDPLENGLRYW